MQINFDINNKIIHIIDKNLMIQFNDETKTILNIHNQPVLNQSKIYYISLITFNPQIKYLFSLKNGEKCKFQIINMVLPFEVPNNLYIDVFFLNYNIIYEKQIMRWSLKFFFLQNFIS
jgi:hypothetical protein